MKETIHNELMSENFDSMKNIHGVYDWLDGDIINTSLPNLLLVYERVGPIVLKQERSYPIWKQISLVGKVTNTTVPEKQIYFDDGYLVPKHFSTFRPWGLKSTNNINESKPFGNQDLINDNKNDTSFTIYLNERSWHSDIRRLKEKQYIDEWTTQIRVQLVFHSPNIDGNCLVRIDFDNYPSSRLRQKIEYH